MLQAEPTIAAGLTASQRNWLPICAFRGASSEQRAENIFQQKHPRGWHILPQLLLYTRIVSVNPAV